MSTVTGGLPPWRRSTRDGQLHLIGRVVAEVSEALCTHTVPTAELAEPGGEDEPRCHGCLLVLGDQLASRIGDRDRYAV